MKGLGRLQLEFCASFEMPTTISIGILMNRSSKLSCKQEVAGGESCVEIRHIHVHRPSMPCPWSEVPLNKYFLEGVASRIQLSTNEFIARHYDGSLSELVFTCSTRRLTVSVAP